MTESSPADTEACVFRSSSAREARVVLEALTNRGFVAQLDSELVPDAMMVENPDGTVQGDYDFTVSVRASHADAAESVLSSLGFESKASPFLHITREKPWVTVFRKVVGYLVLAGVLLWLVTMLRIFLDNSAV